MDLNRVRKDFEKAEMLRLQADALEECHKKALAVEAMNRLDQKCRAAGIEFEILGTFMPQDTIFISGIYPVGAYEAIDKLALKVQEEINIPGVSVFSEREYKSCEKEDGGLLPDVSPFSTRRLFRLFKRAY